MELARFESSAVFPNVKIQWGFHKMDDQDEGIYTWHNFNLDHDNSKC